MAINVYLHRVVSDWTRIIRIIQIDVNRQISSLICDIFSMNLNLEIVGKHQKDW